MDSVRRIGIGKIVWVLAVVLISCSLIRAAETGQAGQKQSDQLLLAVMDMHAELVTNQVFIAQAGVVAAYLETARGSDEAMKVQIYTRVQRLLSKIQPVTASGSEKAEGPKQAAEQNPSGMQPDKTPTKYIPGQALLEIFKGDSISQLPAFPIIRTYWRQGLACENFPVPGREKDVGGAYVARYTFWYEAAQPGEYGFTLTVRGQDAVLRIGGEEVVKSSYNGVAQGVCRLEKGFHRVEFLATSRYTRGEEFQMKVNTPGAFEAIPFSQNMMLLKADQLKAPQDGQLKKTGGQAVPYVDY